MLVFDTQAFVTSEALHHTRALRQSSDAQLCHVLTAAHPTCSSLAAREQFNQSLARFLSDPVVSSSVVRLLHGLLISRSLDLTAEFTRGHAQVSFLHMDADLYSSTDTVLRLLQPKLSSNAVLVFDGKKRHARLRAGAELDPPSIPSPNSPRQSSSIIQSSSCTRCAHSSSCSGAQAAAYASSARQP